MRFISTFLIFLALSAATLPVAAHEFWIDSPAFQVQSGATVEADLRNGQNFKGIILPYFSGRTTRFDVLQNGALTPIDARDGDRPAFQRPVSDGLLVLVYEAKQSTITYQDWSTFADFVAHKGFGDIASQHRARGLPDTKFKEIYTRYCKALIGVGQASGADRTVGMETEFVAITNPYDLTFTGEMTVDLFYQGQPRANTQVEVYERSADKTVAISIIHTDAQGRAQFLVKPGHDYMVDAVVLRKPSPAIAAETGAVWESLWASLTFRAP